MWGSEVCCMHSRCVCIGHVLCGWRGVSWGFGCRVGDTVLCVYCAGWGWCRRHRYLSSVCRGAPQCVACVCVADVCWESAPACALRHPVSRVAGLFPAGPVCGAWCVVCGDPAALRTPLLSMRLAPLPHAALRLPLRVP